MPRTPPWRVRPLRRAPYIPPISFCSARILLRRVGSVVVGFHVFGVPRFSIQMVPQNTYFKRFGGLLEILSSTGAGVWRKAPMPFPDSSSVLDKFQSARETQKGWYFGFP